ncbi:MAG: site-specific DNA-methyltransferase [Methanothrix sp.]|jgi:DNA modification methylase|nr:site-specific DNA-methyltransferase [Methanothrix sp.]
MDFLNKITLGNSYLLLKEISDKSIDLVVTDPPYRIHADSGGGLHNSRKWLKNVHDSNLDEFDPDKFLLEIKRVLKVFNAYIFCSKDLLVDYINFATENKYNWDLLIMGKTNPIPTKNNKYLSDIEYLMYIRECGACFNNLVGKEHFYKYKKIKMTNVKASKYGHPTEKPLNIIKELIEISSNKEDIILDPFSGSGTTVIACRDLNRKFIAFEINKEFYENSIKRYQDKSINDSMEQKTFFDLDEEL